jgi:hypothetical protein
MSYVHLGGVSTDSAVAAVATNYARWKTFSLRGAAQVGGGTERTIKTVIDSTDRVFLKFMGGDLSKADGLQKTMQGVLWMLKDDSNLPTVTEAYNTTVAALKDVVMSVAKAGGEAVGIAIKTAAQKAGVDPEAVGGGIKTIAIAAAIGLVALAVIKSR